MSNRAFIVIAFVLALAFFGICPSARCDDATGLPEWVTSFISQHLNYPTESSAASKMLPEEAARALLDSLLDEDTIRPLLSDYDLRIEFGRVAAYLREPISEEFSKTVQSEDSGIHVRAMLWADGLMRLAPRKREQVDLLHEWETARRPWSLSDANSQLNDANAFGEYIAFSKKVGVIYDIDCPYEMSAAFLRSAGAPNANGEASTSWWRNLTYEWVGGYFWGNLLSYALQEDVLISRWKVNSALDLLTNQPGKLEGFIEAQTYFRPLLPIVLLKKTEAGHRSIAEGTSAVIDTLLEIWDLWLDREDQTQDKIGG